MVQCANMDCLFYIVYKMFINFLGGLSLLRKV